MQQSIFPKHFQTIQSSQRETCELSMKKVTIFHNKNRYDTNKCIVLKIPSNFKYSPLSIFKRLYSILLNSCKNIVIASANHQPITSMVHLNFVLVSFRDQSMERNYIMKFNIMCYTKEIKVFKCYTT